MAVVAERYPFTDEELVKGQSWTKVQLLERFPHLQNLSERRYQFGLLHLIAQTDKQLAKRGDCWKVRQKAEGLEICTDADASLHTSAQIERSIRSIKKNGMIQAHVDIAPLTVEQQAAHERRKMKTAFHLQAIYSAEQKERELLAYEAERRRQIKEGLSPTGGHPLA